MPNWCDNRIEITGPNHDVWRLLAHSAGIDPESLRTSFGPHSTEASRRILTKDLVEGETGTFTLGGCIPMPKDLANRPSPFIGTEKESERLIALYGFNNWYHWAINTWGTKWDVLDPAVEEASDGRVVMTFGTAWSPPRKWSLAVSRMYPHLTIRLEFFEPGDDEEGWFEYHGGEVEAEGDWLEWAQEWRD